jgi:DNA-directed RNA polymerase subunit H (RpoH/RPB5)
MRASQTSVVLVWPAQGKQSVGKSVLKAALADQSPGQTADGVVLVALGGLTPLAAAERQSHVQLFTVDELLIDIADHVDVPRYQVLTDDEVQATLSKYRIVLSQVTTPVSSGSKAAPTAVPTFSWPWLCAQVPPLPATDIAARYFGLEPGQMVRVTYKAALNGALSPGVEEAFCRIVQSVQHP